MESHDPDGKSKTRTTINGSKSSKFKARDLKHTTKNKFPLGKEPTKLVLDLKRFPYKNDHV